MQGGDEDDTQYGGHGDDSMQGGSGDDTQYGGKGNDSMEGNVGNDTQYGGDDDDTMYGDRGNDTQYGGKGNDALYGGLGNDTLYGDEGDDELHMGQGGDVAYGGAGNDIFIFDMEETTDDDRSVIMDAQAGDSVRIYNLGYDIDSLGPSVVQQHGNDVRIWYSHNGEEHYFTLKDVSVDQLEYEPTQEFFMFYII